ncbi:MAG: hypothetical protein RBT59_09860 [Arcobacteraceae bacterium]|jgi:hypothetical protein|nr:hypothetical protein [Arcobacteraceae bacterium]
MGKDEIVKIYSFEISGNIDENSIRGRYKKSIISYYEQNQAIQNLEEKKNWIEIKVKNVK